MHLICQSPPCCSIVKIKARYNSLPLASKVGKLASNAAKLPFQTKVVGKVVQLKVARYSFSGPIPLKCEHKLRRQKQSFGKIATTVVLDNDENLL